MSRPELSNDARNAKVIVCPTGSVTEAKSLTSDHVLHVIKINDDDQVDDEIRLRSEGSSRHGGNGKRGETMDEHKRGRASRFQSKFKQRAPRRSLVATTVHR